MKIELVGPAPSIYVRTVRILLAEKQEPHTHDTTWPGHDDRPAHPFGLAPVLYIDGEPLYESRAIAHLIDHGLPGDALTPRDPLAAARYEQCVSLLLTRFLPSFTRFTQAAYFPATRGLSEDEESKLRDCMKAHLDWLAANISPEGCLAGPRFGLSDAYLIPILDYLFEIDSSRTLLAESLVDYRATMADRPSVRSTRVLL